MHTSCSTLFLLRSSWEMKKVCLVSTQKEEMGAGLWKNFLRLGVCFMLQWLAKFDTKFLKYWCPYTTD